MTGIIYKVYPKDRIVTGSYTFDRRKLILEKLSRADLDADAVSLLPKKDLVTVTAKAVCQDGDEFDVEYGKRLVEEKICELKHEKMKDELKRLYGRTYRIGKELSGIWTYHFKKAESIKNDLRNYYGLER